MATLGITAESQRNNFLKLATSVKDAQAAAKAENKTTAEQKVATNPNNKLERTPEQDTCSFQNDTKTIAKEAIKGASLLYMVGFCFGFCPGLFMVAAGAFLFSNKGQSFMEKLADSITNNASALNKFNQMQAQQKPETTAEKQPAANDKATNPIQTVQKADNVKEEPKMTPMQKAQADVAKREKAVELRAARLEQAQADYDEKQAKLEQAFQRVESYKKAHNAESESLNKSYSLRQDEAAKSNHNLITANASYKKACADLEAAKLILEDMQAEEIVDVD
ncbi:MAG: hypothetical protein K6C94_02415 [Candidatus Gastranaerophilales bacterium]|nr:hypothetical protein [Candidatus Gastranaerophilales bacterium]